MPFPIFSPLRNIAKIPILKRKRKEKEGTKIGGPNIRKKSDSQRNVSSA